MSEEYAKDYGIVQNNMVKDNFGILQGEFSSPNSLYGSQHAQNNLSLKKQKLPQMIASIDESIQTLN